MPSTQQHQPASPEYAKEVARAMTEALETVTARYGDVGVQAVLREAGQSRWSGNRGLAIRETSTPVTDQTMFGLASFGKLVLTTFALHQVEVGKLELDRTIDTYVGDTIAGSGVVTARMLIAHTAGYSEMDTDPNVTPFFPPWGPGAGTGAQYDPNQP